MLKAQDKQTVHPKIRNETQFKMMKPRLMKIRSGNLNLGPSVLVRWKRMMLNI